MLVGNPIKNSVKTQSRHMQNSYFMEAFKQRVNLVLSAITEFYDPP